MINSIYSSSNYYALQSSSLLNKPAASDSDNELLYEELPARLQ